MDDKRISPSVIERAPTNLLDMQDWRGRALRAEKELEKASQSVRNLRALKEHQDKLLAEMSGLLRRFAATEEVYYGGGEYASAPVMTRYEIEQECRKYLKERFD